VEKYNEDKKAAKKDLVKPVKPPKVQAKTLPKNLEGIEKLKTTLEKKISDLNVQKRTKDENKSVSLGTSKINYCDPRITVSWCNRSSVAIAKCFSKTLQQKFPWAMRAPDEYKF
jgi:DNA topoisomerase-1